MTGATKARLAGRAGWREWLARQSRGWRAGRDGVSGWRDKAAAGGQGGMA
ncbi:hypothetical protein LWC34_24580 [Kibdelosporangium philippinense]|uniref:Uncharacterized protein n=1 Tax=Kibdelosporangium philippinense TaxID=211113 RepID=A0ABS8ZG00_9PSEU|nr:hypothetical protein [Kibdelosporangium philippinense]MCE7005983.1 hypothetical protein [Kibdelosporangium philippinense]